MEVAVRIGAPQPCLPAPVGKDSSISLVSIPVKAYTASSGEGGEIHLNQLHGKCNSRIKYKKTCPIHGEVSNDEIVSGYEHAKDQYVVIDTDELERLRTEDPKAITIQEFIAPDALDPLYFKETTYYLVPDGPVGQRPYAVLYQGLVEQKRYGIARWFSIARNCTGSA